MEPYFKNRKLSQQLLVTCGRCEREFYANLKKRKDYPVITCPKCKALNRFNIVWR